MTVLFSGLIASFTSLIVTSLLNYLYQRTNSQRRLDDTLMQLNKNMLENPFLENDSSLAEYIKLEPNLAKKMNDQYNIFCIMKYNYLEEYCRFYQYKINKISKKIHLKEYLKDNEHWWAENRKINYEAYDKKFLHIIEEVVNEA